LRLLNAMEEEKSTRKKLQAVEQAFGSKDVRLLLSTEKAEWETAIQTGRKLLADSAQKTLDLQNEHNSLVVESKALAVISNEAASKAIANGALIDSLSK
jgi:hypothetical protein